MRKLKNFIKKLIWLLISNKDGLNTLKILSGPAKGVKLRLDITKEGSYWQAPTTSGYLARFRLIH